MEHFLPDFKNPKISTLANYFPPFPPFNFFETHIFLKVFLRSLRGNFQKVCAVLSLVTNDLGMLQVAEFAAHDYTIAAEKWNMVKVLARNLLWTNLQFLKIDISGYIL